jgi:acetylglutamate kinase
MTPSDVESTEHHAVRRLLGEWMPYIQKFWGSTIVVKYGGAAMTSRRHQDEFARDVVLMQLLGMRPVVVHGGGPQVTEMMHRLGLDARFVRGHRITDAETMEIAKMVLVGKVNKDLVGLVHRHGGTAVGLSGEDARLLVTKPLLHRDEEGLPVDIGFVGAVRSVNPGVLEVLSASAIPIVASIGADEDGQAYNVNADTAAGALAAALHAEKLLLITDVPGVIAPGSDGEERILDECRLAELDALEAAGAISGGMLPKVAAVRAALQAGVGSAHIVDGRGDHAMLLEIISHAGCGTRVLA